MMAWTDLRKALAAFWQARAPRERRLLTLGLSVLLLAWLWSLLLSPAWRLWREAPLRQAQVEAQTQQMLQMQAEAKLLQTPRRVQRDQALHWLKTHTGELLGASTQVAPQGDTVRLTMQAVSAPALAQWLTQAREQALALPSQAQLQRTDSSGTETLWNGTLVLRLP